MGEFAIRLEGLEKRCKGFSLEDVSLTLPKSHAMALVGEKGAGKSTLVKTMLGLLKKDKGSLEIPPLQDIGAVICPVSIPRALSVKDAAFIFSKEYKNWDQKAFEDGFGASGLSMKAKFRDLSKDEAQTLMLVLALSHRPKLLVLDNLVFSSALDRILRNFMKNPENSLLYSSESVESPEPFCDIISMISSGRIVFSRPKDELLEDFRIISLSEKELASVSRKKLIGLGKSKGFCKALVEARDFNSKKFSLSPATVSQIIYFTQRQMEAL